MAKTRFETGGIPLTDGEVVTSMELNIEKLHAFLGVMVNELGAAQNAALVIVGEELDLYRKMAGRGQISAAELAEATDTKERYVREWLSAQAASGFVEYDAATGKFELSPEQAAVFAIDDSPVNMIGGFSGTRGSLCGSWEADPCVSTWRWRFVDGPLQLHVLRDRPVLPARLQGQSRRALASLARWRRREAGARCIGC